METTQAKYNHKFQVGIYNALRELNIPAHLKGYEYLKSALTHLQEHPEDIYHITKGLYPAIAEKHGTGPSRVERGIRHAIEQSMQRIDEAIQYRALGRTGHLTNAEFIATLRESIRVRLAVEGIRT
jgi:two-component system response regulator (stage 0 sporulation protein A)